MTVSRYLTRPLRTLNQARLDQIEDMGYDGQAAVEALPGLLAVLNEIEERTQRAADDPIAGWIFNKVAAVLASCRVKESTP